MLELHELIPRYHRENELVKEHKKIADADNKQIKKVMSENDISEFSTHGLVAKITVAERVDLMEDVLMDKIKEMGIEGIIKTREYIDMNALEDALYHGKINAATLAKAQTKKEVTTLRISAVKK